MYVLFTYILYVTAGICLAQPPWELMKNVTSAEDFARFVKMPDGSPLNISAFLASASFAQSVAGQINAPLATYDECTPRYSTVVLEKDANPVYEYWPPCTRALRCGGCCPGKMQECSPVVVEDTPLMVMVTKVPYAGSPDYEFVQFDTKLVQQHVKCEPACRVKESHCNHTIHDYLRSDCRCSCRNRYDCPTTRHMWDEETCSCKCSSQKDCSGFARFNPITCMCELRRGITVNTDRMGVSVELTDEELEELYGLARESTTSTTTTTLAPLSFNIPGTTCTPAFPCLPGMHPEIMTNGLCQCVLSQTFSLPPLKRRRREAILRRRRQMLLRNTDKF